MYSQLKGLSMVDNRQDVCVGGSDHGVLVSEDGGAMEVQYLPRTNVFLVGVDCGEVTRFDLKHKGSLEFKSCDR